MGGPSRAAAVSVASNSLLIFLKVTVGLLTGAVSILAEAIHSALDLLAAVIAFFGLRAAGKPADREHPFGHGKWENVSGSIEAVLIFIAAVWIIYEAVKRIIGGAEVEMLGWGIAVMAVSAAANTLVSRYLFKSAREHDSLALEADAQHLRTDVITSLGVLLGLLAVQLTGLTILDPIIAIAVALIIVRAAWDILHKSFGGIIDAGLPPAEQRLIADILNEHRGALAGFHEIRTRKAGAQRFLELHLVMPRGITVEESHRMCDHLEADLRARLPRLEVALHVEPCDEDCPNCPAAACPERRES
ncbi:cation diffusion facilitator family transporter [Dehalogenimonas alkenigignens]|uniref:Cation diffusion facilitator family transporter n=1 Tax=Dehalogenimonas alkenigignens TaxID=1217799 RepID=A0A0W0GG84_9CHLR|nr:cation diffusion facilitator family transporter [Dehalogenimonas alkenigignens]KTB47564.1 cation diffusion facilitator family transporter [Dehalogenimonas alkenigignens]